MPKAFEACVKAGGRVRTKTLSGGRYMHICYKGGKSYPGEVKTSEQPTLASVVASQRKKK